MDFFFEINLLYRDKVIWQFLTFARKWGFYWNRSVKLSQSSVSLFSFFLFSLFPSVSFSIFIIITFFFFFFFEKKKKNRAILTNVNPMKPVTTVIVEKADSSFTGSLSKRGSLDVHFCRRSVSRKPCCYLDDASAKRNEGNTYSSGSKIVLACERPENGNGRFDIPQQFRFMHNVHLRGHHPPNKLIR